MDIETATLPCTNDTPPALGAVPMPDDSEGSEESLTTEQAASAAAAAASAPVNEKDPQCCSNSDSGDTASTADSVDPAAATRLLRSTITVRQVQQNTFRNILQGLGPGAYACRRIYPGQDPTSPEVDESLQRLEEGTTSNSQDPLPDEDTSAALEAVIVESEPQATSAVVVAIAEPLENLGWKDALENASVHYALVAFLVVLLVAILVNAVLFL